MWIPAPIYEALPYLYVLAGVLFFSGTIYIGFTAPGVILYLGAGAFSIAYGAVIFAKRHADRQGRTRAGPVKPA